MDTQTIKNCHACHKDLPMEDFKPRTNYCRKCHNEARRIDYLKKNPPKEKVIKTTKTCKVCELTLPIENFSGRTLTCKNCKNAIKCAKNREKNPLKYDLPNGNKICSKCSVEKTPDNFRIKRRTCIDCERSLNRAYRKKNPEKGREWVENNRERMSELQSDHYQKNKDKIRANERFRFKYDATYRLIRNHRSAINKFYKDAQKTSSYCNFNHTELKNWINYIIEQLNDPNITKETYGVNWSFEHVIPLDLYEDDYYRNMIMELWNIRPLATKDNLTKNKHFNKMIFEMHLPQATEYFLKPLKEKPFTKNNSVKMEKINNYLECLRNTLLRETLDRS